MDEYNHCKEILEYYSNRSSYASKSIKSIIEKLNTHSTSGYGELYERIALCSSSKFADEVVDIISVENNTYDLSVMCERMYDTVQLLKAGFSEDDIRLLLNKNYEKVALYLFYGGI